MAVVDGLSKQRLFDLSMLMALLLLFALLLGALPSVSSVSGVGQETVVPGLLLFFS